MTYLPGERVALEHTDDPHTRLRPGDEGTVRRYDPDQHMVHVDWDSGSRLSMCLDAGDRIRRISPPTPANTGNPGWEVVLDAVRAAGIAAGHDAAEWWAQDTVGGRAAGDVAATARRVLAGIDDGDPAVLDTLPTPDSADGQDRYAQARGHPQRKGLPPPECKRAPRCRPEPQPRTSPAGTSPCGRASGATTHQRWRPTP